MLLPPQSAASPFSCLQCLTGFGCVRKKNKQKKPKEQQQQSETDGPTHSLDKLNLCCHAESLICLSRRQGLLVTIHHGISTIGRS